ncbi:hypothetical protein MTO96_025498 [Rhipicephalus appendiculatus]
MRDRACEELLIRWPRRRHRPHNDVAAFWTRRRRQEELTVRNDRSHLPGIRRKLPAYHNVEDRDAAYDQVPFIVTFHQSFRNNTYWRLQLRYIYTTARWFG